MSIYMKADGISGSVAHSGYEGWIELEYADFTGISCIFHFIRQAIPELSAR